MIENLPQFIRDRYQTREWKHASAILERDFRVEWQDIIDVLTDFRLRKSDIVLPGGRKSTIATQIDNAFIERGWRERGFETKVVVDQNEFESPTHKVDCFKTLGVVAIVAESFGAIYERNAVNAGLAIMSAPAAGTDLKDGEEVEVDFTTGAVRRASGGEIQGTPFSEAQLAIYQRGGLLAGRRA